MKINKFTRLINQVQELQRCCGYDLGTEIRVGEVDIKKALKLLKSIVRHTSREMFLSLLEELVDGKGLIYCCLLLIKNSILQFKLDFRYKLTIQPVLRAQTYFSLLLLMLPCAKNHEIVGFVIDFMRDENVWSCESISVEIFRCLVASCECAEEIFNKILDRVDNLIVENELDEAKCCLRILYSIVNINFKELSGGSLMRLMVFYCECIEAKDEIHSLRIGLKVALLRLFTVIRAKQVSEILPEILNLTFNMKCCRLPLLEFNSVVLRGISVLSKNLILLNLKSEIVERLLSTITSECVVESNIACNFLTCLIDRYHNATVFDVPIIFFLKTNYGLRTGDDDDAAVPAITKYAKVIEKSIIVALKQHGSNYESLISIYKLICVILVTLPAAQIIIMVIKLLLKLQNFAIEEMQSNKTASCVHALIISIMTLICYISRAKTLSTYIHNMVCSRYDTAPHLNPPIMKEKGQQRVVITSTIKPELLMDKWELRYCLWMYYKIGEKITFDSYDAEFQKIFTKK